MANTLFWKYSDYLEAECDTSVPEDLCNYIFYGAKGGHKYAAALNAVQKHCTTKLTKPRTLQIVYNKKVYIITMSDIHFEIDMEHISIGAKGLWIYVMQQIRDIILLRKNTLGYIICKNFHLVTNDVLELMHSYVSQQENTRMYYILLTEAISFLPRILLSHFNVVRFHVKTKDDVQEIYKSTIIKNIERHICVYNPKKSLDLRNSLYDIFTYNWNAQEAMGSLVLNLIERLEGDDLDNACVKTNEFLTKYDASYRPILHLEKFALTLSFLMDKTT